jgi:hypothetical protein
MVNAGKSQLFIFNTFFCYLYNFSLGQLYLIVSTIL